MTQSRRGQLPGGDVERVLVPRRNDHVNPGEMSGRVNEQ